MKVTTMTVMARFSPEDRKIPLMILFPLLSIGKIQSSDGKTVIEFSTYRYKDIEKMDNTYSRLASSPSKTLENSLSMPARLSYHEGEMMKTRTISVKLFCNLIHITGIISHEQASLIGDAVMLSLDKTRQFIERIQRDVKEGSRVRRVIDTYPSAFGEALRIQRRMYGDAHLEWLYSGVLSSEHFADVRISSYRKIMVNYNHKLPLRFSLPRLAKLLLRTRDVFSNMFVCYDRCVNTSLTLKFSIEESVFTFIVKESGSITQSGPSEETGQKAALKLLEFLKEHSQLISIG